MKVPNHKRKAHPWRGLARAVRRYRELNATCALLEAAFKCNHRYLQKFHA